MKTLLCAILLSVPVLARAQAPILPPSDISPIAGTAADTTDPLEGIAGKSRGRINPINLWGPNGGFARDLKAGRWNYALSTDNFDFFVPINGKLHKVIDAGFYMTKAIPNQNGVGDLNAGIHGGVVILGLGEGVIDIAEIFNLQKAWKPLEYLSITSGIDAWIGYRPHPAGDLQGQYWPYGYMINLVKCQWSFATGNAVVNQGL